MTNTTLEGNAGHSGGAIWLTQQSSLDCDSCTLANNTAAWYGGGLFADASALAVLASSTVAGNAATQGWGGGAALTGSAVLQVCG